MSRIYHNEKLSALPVHKHDVSSWSADQFIQRGNGFLIEGTVKGRSRHMITDSHGTTHRYHVIYVRINKAHRRQFDASGKETTPNFSEKMKVSTGYLMSSYKTADRGDTDKIPNDRVSELIRTPQLLQYTSIHAIPNSVGFWVEEKQIEKVEINANDNVRLKTRRESPFIDQIVRLEESSKTVANMAGDEKVGASWTDKVLANKSKEEPVRVEVEGVDEDEWDD